MDFEKIRKSNTVTRDVAVKMLGWETKQPRKTKKEINGNRDEKYLNRIVKKYSRNKNTISATYQEEEK
jgi:hypothetical protein